ncbi:MAG: hypothetical protein K2L17_08220, partial [Muribaculaceae bacterium]|nr:hypothetical protein [Muribaculaceae bacterium]
MKETADDLLKKTFIKLRSDYGFKRASMAAEDIVEYRNSIMIEMERQSELEFKKEEGIELGIEKGIGIGREEGRKEEKFEVARKMKKGGMSLGDIMLYTGLSEKQISE